MSALLSEHTDAVRIGYVVKVYPRFSETFIVTEILAREAQGEQIEIFALRPTDDPRFHPELARVNAPVTHLPRPTRPSGVWGLLRAAADADLTAAVGEQLPELLAADVDDAIQAVALAAEVRRRRITHLHAHFGTSPAAVARLAARIAGVPYSFTAHAKDLFHESVDHDALRHRIHDAAYVATVSDFNVRFVKGLAPERAECIHLVPNVVELSRFTYRDPAPVTAGSTLRIAAIGRLVEKKGFDVLLTAVAKLRDAGVPVSLTLAGSGELDTALRRRVLELDLGAIVTMPGPIRQDEVSALLTDADVFVAPCVVGADGNADGLPTVLLEAMAIGVPCVSTPVTGIPEVVIDGITGLLAAPGDVHALADTLRAIADGRIDVVSLARAARSLVAQRHASEHSARRHALLTRGRVPADDNVVLAAPPVRELQTEGVL